MMGDFAKETDLCAAFISSMPKGWAAYPETGGFDILAVRDDDGFQIGIEAKLTLNAKVICQAVEDGSWHKVAGENPDCRAVLIPSMTYGNPLAKLCSLLGVTVISMSRRCDDAWVSSPSLPWDYQWDAGEWFDTAPARRITLPDFVPDVIAGDAAPIKLTHWKTKAIRISVTLEKRGFVTREDFRIYKLDMTRWRIGWLVLDANKNWIAGPNLPDFRAQHPVNYVQIADAYELWRYDRGDEEAA